jgi:hypothetical protein
VRYWLHKKSPDGKFTKKIQSEVFRGQSSNFPVFPPLTSYVAELATYEDDEFMKAYERPIKVTIETENHKVLGEFYFSILKLMKNECYYDVKSPDPSSNRVVGIFLFMDFAMEAAGTIPWNRR